MLKNKLNLYDTPSNTLFDIVKNQGFYEYNYSKHLIYFHDTNNKVQAYLRLPLHLTISPELNIIKDDTFVIYLSIESGNAAICLMKGKIEVYHKTFSAYMTRKKQGMSQIKYLNKKGKSRAGSRVRLSSTIEFFEKINNKLNDLFIEYEIERVALSCTPTLLPYFYDSKVSTPFTKDDMRLYKIPLHIPQSNYTNLSAAIKKLKAPTLFYNDGFEIKVIK